MSLKMVVVLLDLPGFDIFLVVHLTEQLDLDDLEYKVLVAQLRAVVLRLTDLFDSMETQLSNCAH